MNTRQLMVTIFLFGYAVSAAETAAMAVGEEYGQSPPTRQLMQENLISAEVEPTPNHANQAALALQQRGFRILHIGTTISVQGSESLWQSTFNVSFETGKKTVLPGIKGGETTYRKAITDHLQIPAEMQPFITEIMFVEPPELH